MRRSMMFSQLRLMEETVNSEDAVDFYPETDSADDGGSKELVERLRAKVAAVMTESSSSQEEKECQDITKYTSKSKNEVRVTARGDDLSQSDEEGCRDHPDLLLEYWCEEDSRLVCKDCIIFGEHKGHTVVTGEKMRSAIIFNKLAKILPSLQEDLNRTEETGKNIVSEGKENFNKLKEEVEQWLDTQYVQEKRRVTSLLSDHCARLQKTISTIQSLQAGLSSPEAPDPDQVAMLVSQPLLLNVSPGTVVWHETHLAITHPTFVTTTDGSSISDEDSSHSQATSSSPIQDSTSTRIRCSATGQVKSHTSSSKIIPLDIKTIDGATVKIMENGTPGHFYCQLVSSNIKLEMEEMLVEVEDSEISHPLSGQGVLVRSEGRWCRATLLDCEVSSWRCELVDMGQVVKRVKEVDMTNLPPSMVEIPAMTVRCSLAGVEDKDCWTEEAKSDWKSIVHDQQFRMSVVDSTLHAVHLVQGEVHLVDRLLFLGHLPEVTTSVNIQQFSPPGPLSNSASLCVDYDEISPDSLLLYFDNPLHSTQQQELTKLDTLPSLVSPPGMVELGSAVLAPWKSSLFRATVLAVSGTSLTLLFVDYGNTATVSWWDCSAVPRDLMFPPLATQVMLAGVRPLGVGGWAVEGKQRLHHVLDQCKGIVVKLVKSEAGTLHEVELKVRRKNCLQDVGELLVEDGFACCEDEEKFVIYPTGQPGSDVSVSQRSSDASSGTMMSNFLVGEKEVLCDQIDLVNEDENFSRVVEKGKLFDFDTKVTLTGNIDKHLEELDLISWAKQLWEEVDSVKVGFNHVNIKFHSKDSAEECLRKQGKVVFNGTVFEVYPYRICYTNGIYVKGLPPFMRKTDLKDLFGKFGMILFIQGPYEEQKSSVVVFKNLEGMERALLNCADIKLGGKRLIVKKNAPSVRQQKLREECMEPSKVNDETVEVLHIESPHEVYVRHAFDSDRWNSFYQDLQEAGEQEVTGDDAFDPGVKVLCKVESVWHRGTVVDIGRECTVRLVDVGMEVKVGVKDVKKVDNINIIKEKLFAKAVRLSGIEPSGSGGWSASAVDMLYKITKKKKVLLVKKDDHSVDLVVEDVVASDPFDVEDVVRTSATESLLEKGLALKKNTRRMCARGWNSSRELAPGNYVIEEDVVKKCKNEEFHNNNEEENLFCAVNVKDVVINECKKNERLYYEEDNLICATVGASLPLDIQPSSTLCPLLPTQQVFTAMLMHIDSSAVVWVIPETAGHLLSQIIAELGNCSDPVQDVSLGMMVVARTRGRKVRGRVLEKNENLLTLVDIDRGKVFSTARRNVRQVSHSLQCKPPLALPLKLYGVTSNSALCEDYRDALKDKIGKKSSTLFWCKVSLMEKNLKQFPLPANVRYTVLEEYDGNLGLDLVEMGLFDIITNFSQWEWEVSNHDLDWMLDPMSVSHPLAFLPHPLPLAVGQWLHVSVEGIEYPLEKGEEREPDTKTPDANRIGVQLKPMSSESTFDQYQEDICQSLNIVTPQIQKLNSSFQDVKISLAISASTAEKVASPTVGQSVLVLYQFSGEGEGGEWCRGTVETIQRKGRVTIHYTDYGHRGQVEVAQLRSLRYQERMMPVQLREVMFLMPDSNRELGAVRLDLRQEEKMMMRVENITPIGHPMEMEEILVSVWRAVDGEGTGSYLLSKIC